MTVETVELMNRADPFTGLEIATATGAFATKLFTYATKIYQSVANLRLVCCQPNATY